MIINLEINPEIFPKLSEIENEKLNDTILFLLNIGYQNVFSSINENNLTQNINNICRKYKDDIINNVDLKNESIKDKLQLLQLNVDQIDINSKFEDFSKILEKLFGITSSSSKKGEISEELIHKIFDDRYPNYCYDIKRHIAHNADGLLVSPSGLNCLVEIKNYTNTVNKDEIEKFKYDLKYTNNTFGLFISLQSGIYAKNNIDYETFQDGDTHYHIIYLSKLMHDIIKLDCGILLLENLYKINKKDNICLKIDQIKNVIYQNFNELETLIDKTDNLRREYDNLEKSIKQNLDFFYNKLRSYDIEMKQKMQKIWINLFDDLKDIDKNYIDMKTKILTEIGEKDKCYLIISRIFDFLNSKNINVSINDNNNYKINKDNETIGYIKKMKDKIQLNLENPSIFIIFKSNDNNIDTNLEFLNFLF